MQVKALNIRSRYGHIAAAFRLSPGITEVAIFGGESSVSQLTPSTTVLRFGEP